MFTIGIFAVATACIVGYLSVKGLHVWNNWLDTHHEEESQDEQPSR